MANGLYAQYFVFKVIYFYQPTGGNIGAVAYLVSGYLVGIAAQLANVFFNAGFYPLGTHGAH